MDNQVIKSSLDAVKRIAGLLYRSYDVAPCPKVPMVFRVAAAGHLRISNEIDLSAQIETVLKALQSAAAPRNELHWQNLFGEAPSLKAEMRLLSQLAAGFDQLAAERALILGYKLHSVLPGKEEQFRIDVAKYGHEKSEFNSTEQRFSRLLGQSERVLQLDAYDAIDASGFSKKDYAQAGKVILQHADLLLVGLHADAGSQLGGTRWLMELAAEANIPVILLSIDERSKSNVEVTEGRTRVAKPLYVADSDEIDCSTLNDLVLRSFEAPAQPVERPKEGWLERRLIEQLDPTQNRSWWKERWTAWPEDEEQSPSAHLKEHIEIDFMRASSWADHRASAFAEMIRGGTIITAILTLMAILGAAIGLMYDPFSVAGKLLEVFCLAIVAILAVRSIRYGWLDQWLNVRLIERRIELASRLALIGRSAREEPTSSRGNAAGDARARWCDHYATAVIRAASFPTAYLSSSYLNGVNFHIKTDLVEKQRAYFSDAARSHENAEHLLYRAMVVLAAIAIGAALVYLGLTALKSMSGSSLLQTRSPDIYMTLSRATKVVAPVAGWLGILCPAIIAALAAIRSAGEYERLASRYEDNVRRLESLPLMESERPTSEQLAGFFMETNDALVQEVVGWGSIFNFKTIEAVQ